MYGQKLRELRKEKGLSLETMAKEIGIPYITISNYERETRFPNLQNLLKFRHYFGVSVDYLLRDDYLPEETKQLEKAQ